MDKIYHYYTSGDTRNFIEKVFHNKFKELWQKQSGLKGYREFAKHKITRDEMKEYNKFWNEWKCFALKSNVAYHVHLFGRTAVAKKKKRTKKPVVGGGYKSEMRNARMNSIRRRSKCKRKYTLSTVDSTWIRENRKLWSDDTKQFARCRKREKEKYKASVRKVNQKFKAESKKAKQELKKNCCKCHYYRTKSGQLRKLRGPWGHCSYDMTNCCKDKKTIDEIK